MSSTSPSPGRRLILASGSPYRRQLLDRLQLHYEVVVPGVDETPEPGESCADLARRLAADTARAVAATHPGTLVIGSDQVADLDGQPLGKPGNRERAAEQLRRVSGCQVVFHTGLCLIDGADGSEQLEVDPFVVAFRPLTAEQIGRYLDREQPYDCAGGFKAEGLGITLFERLQGDDPNSLIGLPLIRLCRMLARVGIEQP
ncbi:MAG: Maf family nucleotide pyrophosphatase [Candidatus Competibacterales bacterium]|nr:Maf family nucleotide pyrophosphatase [Candidatus Competibacterales bacterium]